MTLAETLKTYERLSNEEMDVLLSEPVDESTIYQHVVAYIKYRFMLADDKFWCDDIRQLSEYSIKKIMKLPKDEPLDEISMSCTGASSSAERKVLLILALRKKLGISFDADESVDIETVTQLAQAITRKLAEKALKESD